MDGLQFVQEILLATACSMFGFERLHKFCLVISNLLRDWAFTNPRSNDTSSHLGNAVHEKGT